MAEFPSPADLRARYEKIMGFSLEAPAAKPLLTRYVGGEGQRRYFQDAAIRAVFEKVAQCARRAGQPRALLSLATGHGQDVHRVPPAEADRRRRSAEARAVPVRPRRTAHAGPQGDAGRLRRRRR